jgi:serine/threonine protein kinase
MNKQNLVRSEQQKNVMNEKLILDQCQYLHPFVLKLFSTYQDRDSLYMVLEFIQGGELFSIMQEKFRFPLYPTMFYSACIIDLFESLHLQSIIYRDLKPENVLIDKFGYVKLADFGFAKKMNLTAGKTYTLCGTPEYLAPEVVLGVGHDKGVDYWGIGILIYEMLVGMSPFADEYDEDQQVVCTNIVKGRVPYDKLTRAIAETESKQDPFWTIPTGLQRQSSSLTPPGLDRTASSGSPSPSSGLRKSLRSKLTGSAAKSQSSNLVEDLIRKLLNKSPLQRLGNLKDGAKDVKQHLFFKTDIDDWEELRQRRIPAPFIPVLRSEEDTSRFDQFDADLNWPPYKGSQDWCEGF